MAYDPSVVELIPAFNAGRAAKRDRTDEAYRRDALEAMKDRANKQYIADIAKTALADKAQNYRNEYLQFQKQQEARIIGEQAMKDRDETLRLRGLMWGLTGSQGPLTKEQQDNPAFMRGLLEADVQKWEREHAPGPTSTVTTTQSSGGNKNSESSLSVRVANLTVTKNLLKMVKEGKISREDARRIIKDKIAPNLERWEATYAGRNQTH